MYNSKNKECQQRFKAYTSNTKNVSSVLDSEEDIDIFTKRFINKIDGCIAMTFKKVRITHNKKGQLEKLMDKARKLKD